MVKVCLPVPAAGFILVLVLGLCCVVCCLAKDHQYCKPSSCGSIHYISYPFRLTHDPKECGDFRYNLSCENNITVVYLHSGRYYVLAINYENATIRVVDTSFQKGNCSSVPHYSVNTYNSIEPYSTYQWRGTSWILSVPFILYTKLIIFTTCEVQPKHMSSLFVDTSPCINKKSGHSFVNTDTLNVSDLMDSCRVELMVRTSWNGTKVVNRSYIDIHNELLYGFELSWLHDYGGPDESCYINNNTNRVVCNRTVHMSRSILPQGILIGIYSLSVYAGILIGLWAGVKIVLGVPCVIVVLILMWKRRHLSMYTVIEDFLQSQTNLMPIRYSYSNIKKMTKGFQDKLGEGGYGSVYKGKLRSGRFVAVKMLGKSKANGQDFMNEVATIGRIHHVNVVQLIGYCAEGSKRALVYEYMSNGSLDKHIFSNQGSKSLSCKEAFEISLGVARGIGYLHQGCEMRILHFDIKPHNILLNDNFVPKVSDFGLARLCPLDESSLILTAARGTMGYIAPEFFYKNIGGVSNKADMYSFGMLLMEMAGKRKNVNAVAAHSSQIYFPSWAYDQLSEGNEIEIEDATDEEKKLTKKMIMVALWCIQMKPSERPKSMSKVIDMLEGEVESIPMPPKPFLYPQDSPVAFDVNDSEASSSSSLPLRSEGQLSSGMGQNSTSYC